ncbi:MAG: helix-turn-helix transcriptional regulator [Paracoccaceae bacterium]
MAKVIKSELVGVFAQRMREQRALLEITQEEVAHRADLDRTYISGCERGLRNPSLVSVEKIATALEISAHKLLND